VAVEAHHEVCDRIVREKFRVDAEDRARERLLRCVAALKGQIGDEIAVHRDLEVEQVEKVRRVQVGAAREEADAQLVGELADLEVDLLRCAELGIR